MAATEPRVTAWQVRCTRAVVRWYLETHFAHGGGPGMPMMFCNAAAVGAFAVERQQLTAGTPEALFKLLVTVAMFQRLRDVLVMRILRSIPPEDAHELTSHHALLRLADDHTCSGLRGTEALRQQCDLHKTCDGRGSCTRQPLMPCHLKRHTVLLRRYGHFGKVPTSIALAVRESGAADLSALYQSVLAEARDGLDAAKRLEAALSRAWRINQKLSAMFLSLVSNPDLLPDAPWSRGIDWTYFVVVDSNVDLFLQAVGYSGSSTYDARASFVRDLSRRIDLSACSPGLHSYNPRLVQQALYLFMSVSNRKLAPKDCSHAAPAACRSCRTDLRSICPLRRESGRASPSVQEVVDARTDCV